MKNENESARYEVWDIVKKTIEIDECLDILHDAMDNHVETILGYDDAVKLVKTLEEERRFLMNLKVKV